MTKGARKILIVEDEPKIASLLKDYLATQGAFETRVEARGDTAMEAFEKFGPDLVLLDLMLPGMDGYKVSRLLKFDERFKKIPIIMLTAKDQEEDKALGEQTGADHYMTKPFAMDKLLAKIKEFLGE